MMVIRTAATKPVAGNTLAQDEAPADAQVFSQLLDEKTAASATKSPQPARGAARADSPEPADSDSAENVDETSSPAAEAIASESLLVFLNQFRDSLPTGEDAKKETQLAQKDALPGSDLPFGSAQLPGLLNHADVAPPAVETTPLAAAATPVTIEATAADEDNDSAALAAASLPPVIADATTAHADEGVTSAFTHRFALAAGLKPTASQQDAQTGAAALTPFGAVSTAAVQNPGAPQPATSVLPVKGVDLSHPAERVNTLPDVALSPATVNPPASAAVTEPPAASGLLTQQMGTPAWQQSLGQQIACFTRDGIQHAELRLHPEELGSIQITLQLKNEQAQMHFVSASHQVRAAIEAAVPHLRMSLAESGIELGQSSVGADSSSGWKDSGQSDQSGRQNFAEVQSSDNNPDREERVETSVRTVSYSNGINTFA
jgi:flagellar hook-length control protein FliK